MNGSVPSESGVVRPAVCLDHLQQWSAIEASLGEESLSIVGGASAPQGSWPNVLWFGGACSGLLVHPEVVLYAAGRPSVAPNLATRCRRIAWMKR